MSANNSFQINYPFVSCVKSNDIEYVGIVINFDNFVTSIYDISVIKSDNEKRVFLELGESWWWESNRMVPINIFLKQDWNPFKPTLKTFNSKDVELKYGPALSLKENSQKRSKRRSITLVRKI